MMMLPTIDGLSLLDVRDVNVGDLIYIDWVNTRGELDLVISIVGDYDLLSLYLLRPGHGFATICRNRRSFCNVMRRYGR